MIGKRRAKEPEQVLKARTANFWSAIAYVLVVAGAITTVASSRGNVWIGLLTVSWLGFTVRMRTIGAYLGPTELKIVNPFSTSRVPWEDVDRFEIAPLAQYPYGVYLVRNGTAGRISIFALAGGRLDGGRYPQKCVDALNETLRLRSSVPSAAQGFVDSLR